MMRSWFAVALFSLSLPVASLSAQPAANPIGVACTGTNGAPSLAASQPPYIRETITFSLANLPTVPGFVFLVFGTNDILWNGLPLPADLGFTGMPGCNVYVAPEGVVFLPHSVTTLNWPFLVPDSNFLVGCRVVCQALVCDSRVGNALGATTTNAVELVFGRR